MNRALLPALVGLVAAGGLVASASAQITIASTTTAFNDISATGTSPGSATDDAEFTVTSAQLSGAGFAGNELLPLANIRIGNNGAVLWGTNVATANVGYINRTDFGVMVGANGAADGNGGSATTPGTSFLCPLWDDNTPASGMGAAALDWQVIGGNLIIQWSNEDHFNAAGVGTVQYQAIVYGGATIASGAPLVDFVYNDTLYQAAQYQNDGGSATIGYKNWGTVAAANDVEFGAGGGTNSLGDPPFGDASMRPKVAGYAGSADPTLPNAVRIAGSVPPTGTGSCFGDDSGTDCPCSTAGGGTVPPGATGNGCPSSVNPAGANLGGTGNPSISADTVSLNGAGMPNSSALYFQGNSLIGSGSTAGSAFGDGLRCATGGVIRLKTVTNVAGASSYPQGGDPSVSVRGGVLAPGVRHYQIWYRNAAPFCTGDTFNLSNAFTVIWGS